MINRNLQNLQLLQQIARNPFAKTVAPRVFDIADDYLKDMQATAANRDLSPEGRQKEAHGHARRALRDLRDSQKPLEEFSKQTKTMNAAAKMPAYDKTDFVAALNRREM